jgi:signal transduction histidine kinase
LNVSVSPIMNEGESQPHAAFITFDDITDRRTAQRALEQARQDLANANAGLEKRVAERTEQLNTFCHSVAHDLRGPIRTQAGFARLLLDQFSDQLGEGGCTYARHIAQAAERQSALITDLLAYMSLSNTEILLEELDVCAALRDACDDLKLELQESQARLTLPSTPPVLILANRSALHLVLINLISNAVKFVPPHDPPRITIEAEERGTKVRISVLDNGIGIEEKDLAKLFGLFQRLNKNSRYSGTGMGLANVKKAVERMGGSVGVKSAPGQGSCFWVELPAPGITQRFNPPPNPEGPASN